MMKKITNRMNQFYTRALVTANQLAYDRSGEGYLDLAMRILITVVLGAAILAILNTAVPSLFSNMINKISQEWNNVTILPR